MALLIFCTLSLWRRLSSFSTAFCIFSMRFAFFSTNFLSRSSFAAAVVRSSSRAACSCALSSHLAFCASSSCLCCSASLASSSLLASACLAASFSFISSASRAAAAAASAAADASATASSSSAASSATVCNSLDFGTCMPFLGVMTTSRFSGGRPGAQCQHAIIDSYISSSLPQPKHGACG